MYSTNLFVISLLTTLIEMDVKLKTLLELVYKPIVHLNMLKGHNSEHMETSENIC